MGFYCFQDKSGHCQDKHATYHETSGGSYDGDSGGGDGSSSPGETVGALIFLAVIAGVIYWVFASLNDWMDSNHSTEQQASFARASYADSSQPAGGMSRRIDSQIEVNRLLSVAKGRDSRPFFATTIWKDGSFPGIVLTEGGDSIAFNLRSNATIGNGSLVLPIPGGWSKNFHFPKDVEFTCSIICGGCDLVFIDKDGLAVATTRTDASVDIDHFFTRSFSVRAHEYNGSMIVLMSKPKNAGVELERKKAQSSSLRLRELDEQYASEELEFDREIERLKKETASSLPKLDEQYAAKTREFETALRLGDFELAKRKGAESLRLLDKRNALEEAGAVRVNEILKQKLAAIKAAVERIRAD